MVFSKDSWHYYLVNKYSDYVYRNTYDICSYVRTLTWIILKRGVFYTLMGVLIAGIAAAEGGMLGWLISGIIHGFVDPIVKGPTGWWMGFGFFGAVFDLAVAITAVVVTTRWLGFEVVPSSYREHKRRKKAKLAAAGQEMQPGFLSTWYDALKTRTCHFITFE